MVDRSLTVIGMCLSRVGSGLLYYRTLRRDFEVGVQNEHDEDNRWIF
jgi:hypothetical protein